MIRRLRDRLRPAAANWLLVRPDDARAWRWQHWQAGTLAAEGDWPPPAALQALHCALVVPVDAVSYFETAAPPGVRPDEWPMLLEDRLLQSPETVRVGCIGRRGKTLQLVALDRARLARWQRDATALGVHVERFWSEFQLVPEAKAGEAQQWTAPPFTCLVRADEQGGQKWLAVPEELAEAVLGDALQTGRAVIPGSGVVLDGLPSLQPTSRAPRSAARWRGTVRLAGACAALSFGWAVLAGAMSWQEGSLVRASLSERLGTSTLQQAESRLRTIQRDDQQRLFRQQQVRALGQAVDAWLVEHPEWALESLGFDGRYWEIKLNGYAEAPESTSRWDRLASEVGGTASLTQSSGTLIARVDLEGGGT